MSIYYKTSKNSDTGLKFQNLLVKGEEFKKQVEILRKKYLFTTTFCRSDYLYGASLALVEFTHKPDLRNWEKIEEYDNIYKLRYDCESEEVINDFKELNKKSVKLEEFELIIGNENTIKNTIFEFDATDVYLFIIDDRCGYKIPKDCKRITKAEYNKLINNEI